MNSLLLTAYCPPISFFHAVLSSSPTWVEIYDHYGKQTYRNRCKIMGANGAIDLTVPVKLNETKCITKEVRLDYSTDWNRVHWNTICSAYGSTPFFEYYKDDLAPFYTHQWEYLWEYNHQIIQAILDALELNCAINYTTCYVNKAHLHAHVVDLRESIYPKPQKVRNPLSYAVKEYRQLFASKYGFVANLSMLDLLFNKGPEAIAYLL